MKRIPRHIFTEEFKREAIKLVTEQGLTMAEAGRKLDVATSDYLLDFQIQPLRQKYSTKAAAIAAIKRSAIG